MKRIIIFIFLFFLIPFFVLAQELEQFKTDDGETLFFTRAGSGPKVILLCGGPGVGANLMKPWLGELANQFEAVLFEQRGTGLSREAKLDSSTINIVRACQDIDNLRKYLGETKVTLCGYSWGCMLALSYAAQYPTHVKNLVLLSPGSGGVDLSTIRAANDNEKWNTYPVERDSIAYWGNEANRLSDPTRAVLLQTVFSFMNRFYDHKLGRKLLESYLRDFDYNPAMSSLMWQDMNKGFDIRNSVKRYKGPCKIIRPRQEVMPAEIIIKIHEALPQTKIFYIEKCGHLADLERPKELFSLLKIVLIE